MPQPKLPIVKKKVGSVVTVTNIVPLDSDGIVLFVG